MAYFWGECLISEIMGCECCKELSLKDYKECQSAMDLIKSRKATSTIKLIAPCGERFKFGAKITAPKSKKRKNR